MKVDISIPHPIKEIKFKKTGKRTGRIELDLCSPGELITDTERRPDTKL